MKILEERSQFLSNYEVAKHLQELKKKYNWIADEEKTDKKRKRRFTDGGIDLEVITGEVSSYLNKTASSAISSDESFKELMLNLNQLDFVKVEKLQIVNSLPRSMVHLYALVEECDQRFEEGTCQGIIDRINELFPVEEEQENEEDEENVEMAEIGANDDKEQFEDAQD